VPEVLLGCGALLGTPSGGRVGTMSPGRARPVRLTVHQHEVHDMTMTAETAASFLSHRRIAVSGVSRDPADHGGNIATPGCASAATTSSR
jgi:hypothetical protein